MIFEAATPLLTMNVKGGNDDNLEKYLLENGIFFFIQLKSNGTDAAAPELKWFSIILKMMKINEVASKQLCRSINYY